MRNPSPGASARDGDCRIGVREQNSLHSEGVVFSRGHESGSVPLLSLLAESGVKAGGRVVLGMVAGDLHDIGKDLVAMMLEEAGFEVHDLVSRLQRMHSSKLSVRSRQTSSQSPHACRPRWCTCLKS